MKKTEMVTIKYENKDVKIPQIISCNDGGIMAFCPKDMAYVCLNVEGCDNNVSLDEFIKARKNNEMEREMI